MPAAVTWRRSCPFTAGLLTIAAGVELIVVVLTAPGLLSFSGARALASWILGALLIVAGLTTWRDPARRYFAGTTAVVCALLSLVQSNLGGFLLGFGLAALGGALALAWTPTPLEAAEDDQPDPPAERGDSPAAAQDAERSRPSH